MPEEYESIERAAVKKVEADSALRSAVEEAKPAGEIEAFASAKLDADKTLAKAVEGRLSFDWRSASEKTFEDQLSDYKNAESLKDLEVRNLEENVRKGEWEKYRVATEENSLHRFFISHCQNNQLDTNVPNDVKKLHKAAEHLAKNDTKFIALIEAMQLYLDTYYTKLNNREL